MPAVSAAPTIAAVAAPSPFYQLQRAADPALPVAAAARQFDGNAALAVPPPAGSPAASLAPLGSPRSGLRPPPRGPKKPGWIKRLDAATQPASKAERWLERGLLVGLLAGVAAPVVYGAAPLSTLLINVPAALLLPAVISGSVLVYRLARFLMGRRHPPQQAPPGRRMRAAVVGLALGLSMGAAPTLFRPHIVEAIESVRAPEDSVRRLSPAFAEEALGLLSANPVGRDALDTLRDRGGAVRPPPFFVSKQDDSIARHLAPYDAVFIAESQVIARGWTVADFLLSPEKQRQLAREIQPTLVHELVHAAQMRRFPPDRAQLAPTGSLEYEYEAYIVAHLYMHEQLKADPHADVGDYVGRYMSMLADLDGYLAHIDVSYPRNAHIDSAQYRALIGRLRADWPAHQLEAYALLAQRHAETPLLLARHRQAAAEIAAQSGLPLPPSLAPPAPQVR